jgi:hypothetical protein
LAAGGFQAHSARATIFVVRCYGKVDLACQAIDCAGQPSGTADPLDRIRFKTPGRSLVCARSAQKSANPDHAVQTRCSSAVHRQGMKSQPVAISIYASVRKMRPVSCVICFVLALLIVLSIAPALLHLWLCKFSPGCFVGGLWYLMLRPGGFRTLALAIVLGPLFLLPTYVLALLRCHGPRDVLDYYGPSTSTQDDPRA